VVPVHISFFWDSDVCARRNVLLEFDIAVDTFFLFEILITFFVGIYEAGVYRDDLKTVWHKYLRGPFWFDAATSFPVSYFEYAAFEACGDGGNADGTTHKLRLTRVLKPLRLSKMFRVVKALKILEVSQYAERILRPPPILFRLLRVVFGLASVTHVFGCAFWLVKVISNDEEEVVEFLEYNGLSASANVVEKYVLSVYFINTVFTTVGFGDIHASNTLEQVTCVVIMLVGVLVFGTMLSEVQAAVSELRRLALERGHKLHRLVRYLRAEEVPVDLECKIISWVDFDLTCEQEDEELRHVRDSLPWSIQKQLDAHLRQGFLDDIPPFTAIEHSCRDDFLAELWPLLESVTYERHKVIADADTPHRSLRVVVKGRIRLEDEGGELIGEIKAGQYFGEWAILNYCPPVSAKYVALSHVHCLELSRGAFDAVTGRYPPDLRQELERMLDQRLQLMGTELGNPNLRPLLKWKEIAKKMQAAARGKRAHGLVDRLSHKIGTKVRRGTISVPSSPTHCPDVEQSGAQLHTAYLHR